MEFLRFGSQIPGSYHGCCAVDIIQNFSVDPDAPATIQLVYGDAGTPILRQNRATGKTEPVFLGMTYREIFLQRLRTGTFSESEMKDHAFIVVIAQTQIDHEGSNGLKWLAILKEQGFEFIRTVNNSVWNVRNHVFGLFRGISSFAPDDPFTPPVEWSNLPAGPGFDISVNDKKAQAAAFDALPRVNLVTRSQIPDGVPVIVAGKKPEYPQEPEYIRKEKEKRNKPAVSVGTQPSASVFPATTPGSYIDAIEQQDGSYTGQHSA